MNSLIRFCKDWALPIAIIVGICVYFVCAASPAICAHRSLLLGFVHVLQPLLIFAMLFLSFCKVDPRALRLRPWHVALLAIQVGLFVALSAVLIAFPQLESRVVIEGAMLCFICPTATAAIVITNKLGGDIEGLTTYTILINLAVSIFVPLMAPLVNPHPHLGFVMAFLMILGHIFPMLICPFFLALLVRAFLPKLHALILQTRDLAFYLWVVSLSMAVALGVRSLVHSNVAPVYSFGIAVVSLLACIFQFWLGRRIGRRYGTPISCGQAFGQKNTVFAIWVGYTFFTPVTAIAGGFYSIWHNVFNSYQLYEKRRQDSALSSADSSRHA